MEAQEVDALVQRLVANPHDEESLAYAHQAGEADPEGYARLLERLGKETPDPMYASHWLSEAANVWSTTLGDVHHAAEMLLLAVVKDPTQDAAADRLAKLYREKGDVQALVALLEKRAKMLSPLVQEQGDLMPKLGAIHEELGTLWLDPTLNNTKRALENFRKAYEYDPQAVYSIYSARELLKQSSNLAEAVPLFAMEQQLIDDPERKMALYRDEVDVRRLAGDLGGVTDTLRNMRGLAPDDVALAQEQGASILERVEAGQEVPPEELQEGAALYVSLAEMYDGEHGLAYSIAALEIQPSDDRAVQLATYYAEQLGRLAELPIYWKRYVSSNPNGVMAPDITAQLQQAGESVPAEGDIPPLPSQQQPQAAAAQANQPTSQEQAAAQPQDQQPAVEEEPELDPYVPPDPDEVTKLLEEAATFAKKRRLRDAMRKYTEVLALDPIATEAITWLDEHLRAKRKFSDLKDIFQKAARVSTLESDVRKKYLLNVAHICEQQLRDMDGAIQALKQAAQIDSQERAPLRRLLEKGHRWDDLAILLDQEAMDATDDEEQISLLKKLATLQEKKREDLVGAGEAWARIASLTPGDESPILSALKLFEKAERDDLAADVIAENVDAVEAEDVRGPLLVQLGELREKLDDPSGAGEAFADAGELGQGDVAWEAAERCFKKAERWDDAARVVGERASAMGEAKKKAELRALEAEYLFQSEDADAAMIALEDAADLDPTNEQYAKALQDRYLEQDRPEDFVDLLLRRALKIQDKDIRVTLRKQAASLQRDQLEDLDGARETLLLVLEDEDDTEALTLLADDAHDREDFQDEVELLHRLAAALSDETEKMQTMLREAAVLSADLSDLEAAVDVYDQIVANLDDANLEALRSLAELQQELENHQEAAKALEKLLELADTPEDKVELGRQLATLYEEQIDKPRDAIRCLEIVYEHDEEDLEAVSRLVDLCERVENWARYAQLQAVLLDFEGDVEEASDMARKLASVLDERLDRGEDALAALEPTADEGDRACRDAFVELGDRLGQEEKVAGKLRQWYAASGGEEQQEALRGAFDRYLEIGKHEDAAQVAQDLIRAGVADEQLIERLEQVGVEAKNLEAITTAHDEKVRELSGPPRAEEYVRQAEVLVQVGVEPEQAVQHGEESMSSVPPEEAEPLLERLAAMLSDDTAVVELYERQVVRCKKPEERLHALSRAAQVAAERGMIDKAKELLDLALGAGLREENLQVLEEAARQSDERTETKQLRTALAETLATGNHGARDGGRTRSALLRRAAHIAFHELGDTDKAFGWLGDSLVAHVQDETLDELEQLGEQIDDLKRVEEIIGVALEQVFDGPLVRLLVGRRIQLRREKLDNPAGAAEDLKRLHDLSPNDKEITKELSALLHELRDWRSLVQLLEDQILRGKDPEIRSALARQAAAIWEERLSDPREAADAWRRVLRMKPGDPDAKEGLKRAKSNMLKRPASQLPGAGDVAPDLPDMSAPPTPQPAEEAQDASPVAEGDGDLGSTDEHPIEDQVDQGSPRTQSEAPEEEPVTSDRPDDVPMETVSDRVDEKTAEDQLLETQAQESLPPSSASSPQEAEKGSIGEEDFAESTLTELPPEQPEGEPEELEAQILDSTGEFEEVDFEDSVVDLDDVEFVDDGLIEAIDGDDEGEEALLMETPETFDDGEDR